MQPECVACVEILCMRGYNFTELANYENILDQMIQEQEVMMIRYDFLISCFCYYD